jgi:hypothetical protein
MTKPIAPENFAYAKKAKEPSPKTKLKVLVNCLSATEAETLCKLLKDLAPDFHEVGAKIVDHSPVGAMVYFNLSKHVSNL